MPRAAAGAGCRCCSSPDTSCCFVSFFVEITPIPWKAIILNAAVIGFGTWMAIAMTDRSARRLQQEIDALDSL